MSLVSTPSREVPVSPSEDFEIVLVCLCCRRVVWSALYFWGPKFLNFWSLFDNVSCIDFHHFCLKLFLCKLHQNQYPLIGLKIENFEFLWFFHVWPAKQHQLVMRVYRWFSSSCYWVGSIGIDLNEFYLWCLSWRIDQEVHQIQLISRLYCCLFSWVSRVEPLRKFF